MSEELAERIWASPDFHLAYAAINSAWLKRELELPLDAVIADSEITKCVQAAAILASSNDIEKQRVAYSIAACVNDLQGESLPGLRGVFRIVLTRMGNFPAVNTSKSVSEFSRLPTRTAISEEQHRGANEVKAGSATLVLTDFQRRLWDLLIAGRNIAISAPTSGGKSFALQSYLRQRAFEGSIKNACYIVPTRALIAQVTDVISAWRLEEKLQNFQIINVPLTDEVELPKSAIYVLTQERLQVIMATHPSFAPDIIFCDEAQNIQDGARGMLLHNVVDSLSARSPDAQIIFAGPNIRNLSAFSEIFNLKDIAEIEGKTPSVIQNLIVVNTRSLKIGELAIQKFAPDARTSLGTVDIGRRVPSIKERLVRVSERFGRAKPSIVYANRPSDAEGVAAGLVDIFEDVEPNERLKDLAAFVRLAVHEEYGLARCLEHGIGFHYGRIPALVRRGVEDSFADGDIKYLVTTSTLIQGVNFPAANLFVCQPRKGQTTPLTAGEFWNLAGRAGRLGKEFQGNIFLIDYDEWDTSPANESKDVRIQSFLQSTLSNNLDDIEACATQENLPRETGKVTDLEAAFTRLLSDHINGKLQNTLDRCGISSVDQERLTKALQLASGRVSLPGDTMAASPTVSPLRQQRLATYLISEITGGGIPRLEELIPRHPRDSDAYKVLSEVYRICHEQILSFTTPKLHLRMAAISLKWMRGDPLPEIIDENHKRNGGKLSSNIRSTLNDIEEEIRFKYLRLTTCYDAVLAHALKKTGHDDYVKSISALATYLEVGASDQTMISFISLGLSRHTARLLTEAAMDKEMDQSAALRWLKVQDIQSLTESRIILEDVNRAIKNASL